MKNPFKKKPKPEVDKMRQFFETPKAESIEDYFIKVHHQVNGWSELIPKPKFPKDRIEIH